MSDLEGAFMLSTIIIVGVSLNFISNAIKMFVKGKPIEGDYSAYTPESVKTYSTVLGISFLIAGLLFVPYWIFDFKYNFAKITLEMGIVFGAIVLVLVIGAVLKSAILKKKDPEDTEAPSDGNDR